MQFQQCRKQEMKPNIRAQHYDVMSLPVSSATGSKTSLVQRGINLLQSQKIWNSFLHKRRKNSIFQKKKGPRFFLTHPVCIRYIAHFFAVRGAHFKFINIFSSCFLYFTDEQMNVADAILQTLEYEENIQI